MTFSGLTQGPRAANWALTSGTTLGGRENRYSAASAREAMWRALTLKAREPDGTYSDNVTPTSWLSSKEDLRKAYWATTFRSLGDVVHLLQDMAQPQHTRNDSHSGFACVPVSASCLAGHDSFFEKYIRARTLRSAGFQLAEALAPPAVNGDIKSIAANPLDYDSYPIAISSPAPSPTPPASSTTSSAAN